MCLEWLTVQIGRLLKIIPKGCLQLVPVLLHKFSECHIVSNFKIDFLFSLRYISVPKADYFSARRIGGRPGQGGRGKYARQRVGEEDFPAASASGT